VLDELSLELAEIKDKYSLCSAEVLVKQTELDELSLVFKEHVKHCSDQLQMANQNTEIMMAEMQLQVESSTSQIKVAGENIKRLTGELEEKSRSLEEMQHLIEAERRITTDLQQQAESSNRMIEAEVETISKLRKEVKEKTSALEEERQLKETEVSSTQSFWCKHYENPFIGYDARPLFVHLTTQCLRC